jgi:threonine/homoserine/homoserine lactone efflux protein
MVLKGFQFGMLLQIAVGPICLFIFQTATSSGFFAAETGVLGVTIVDALYILAAIFGMGAILNKYEKAKEVIKYFGAIVLVIFGLSNIVGSFGISILPSLNFLSNQSVENVFLKTLLLTISNPLTILFWAGLFSTKIAQESMQKKDIYLFGLGAVLSTALFLTLISILGSYISSFLDSEFINVLNMIVGLVLVAFGINNVYNG